MDWRRTLYLQLDPSDPDPVKTMEARILAEDDKWASQTLRHMSQDAYSINFVALTSALTVIMTTQSVIVQVSEEKVKQALVAILRLSMPDLDIDIRLDASHWEGDHARLVAEFASLVANGYFNQRGLVRLIEVAGAYGIKLDYPFPAGSSVKVEDVLVKTAEIFFGSPAEVPEGWEVTSDERKMQ